MARDVEAGRAYIRVSTKEDFSGLKAMSAKLKAWGAGIAGIGAGMAGAAAGVLAPLAGMVNAFSEVGSSIADMSARTGVSASKLSALGYAAGMTGSSIEDLEKGIRTMQKNGLSADKLGAVANKIASIKDPAKRTAYAMSIFGKAGASLIPMLSGGAAGLAEFQKEAERLGLVISDEDAASADELGDAMDKVKGTIKGVGMQIGAALAPILTDLATRLAGLISNVIAFVKANRPLVVTIASVAVGVLAAGTALMAVGGIVAAAGAAIGGLVTVLSAVGAAIGVVLSPVGLLVAGIAAGTAAFITFTETGNWLANSIMGDFGTAFDTIKQLVTGVTDALKSGDIALAGEIAMSGVKLAFFEATKSIRSWWVDMLKDLVSAITVAANKAVEVWAGIRIFLREGIMTNDNSKVEEISKRMKDLKAKRSSMDPAEFDRQYRALVDETSGTLEYEANQNNDIIASANDATQAINRFGEATQQELDASIAEGERRIEDLRRKMGGLTKTASEKAAALPMATPPKPAEVKAAALAGGEMAGGMRGTFSASAAAIGFAGPKSEDLAKKTEENTRKTAKQLERLNQNVANGGAAFA